MFQNRFDIRLQRAQAVPLVSRLDELSKAYRNTGTGHHVDIPRSAKSDATRRVQANGEKRCNCLN